MCLSGRYFVLLGLVRTEEVLVSTVLSPTLAALPVPSSNRQQHAPLPLPPGKLKKKKKKGRGGGKSVCLAPPTRVCNWSILGTVRNGPIKSSIVVLCVQAHYFLMMRDAASIQSFDWKITVTSVTFTELFLCQVILLHIFYSF